MEIYTDLGDIIHICYNLAALIPSLPTAIGKNTSCLETYRPPETPKISRRALSLGGTEGLDVEMHWPLEGDQ